MTTYTSDPLVAIGHPGLTTAPRLAPISLPTPAHLVPVVTEEDVARVRGTLADQRTSSSLYREPSTLKRNRLLPFRNKEKIEAKADPKTWDFTPYELGKALDQFFSTEKEEWPPMALAKALLGLHREHSAEVLWEHAKDSSLERAGSLRRRLTRKGRPTGGTCAWLIGAVQRRNIEAVVVLCQAGVNQASLDCALELALESKAYDIARELLRFGANLPKKRELYERAVSDCTKPDVTFIHLWMSSLTPVDDVYARDAMRTAARTGSRPGSSTNKILSILLEHVPLTTAEEAYEILGIAIKASNLAAIALLYSGVNIDWTPLVDNGIKATAMAVRSTDATQRYRMLHFCFLAGATADTDDLRRLLLREARAKNLQHVAMLIHYGVSPCCYGPDVDTMAWTVRNAELSVLPLLMEAEILPDKASSAIALIPSHASDDTQTYIVETLCGLKGARGQPLSCLLLRAVEQKHQRLISCLLNYGAKADFKDVTGRNSLHIAIQQLDIDLAGRLCAASPTISVLSDSLPLAFASFSNAAIEQLEQVLSLLVAHGAQGAPLEHTVNMSIASERWESVCNVLVPVGMTSQAWGQALQGSIKSDNFEALSLICKQAPKIPEASLEMSLNNILSRRAYHPLVIQRLARKAQKQSQVGMLNRQLISLVRTHSLHQIPATGILLKHGASVSAGNGIVLVNAVAKADFALLSVLITLGPDSIAISAAFQEALRLSKSPRLVIVKMLSSYGVEMRTRSERLLDIVGLGDTELLTTVIGNGQGLWEKDKGALMFTVTQGLVQETEILLRHAPPRADIDASFDAMLVHHHSIRNEDLKIASLLLQQNLKIDKLNASLLTICQRPPLEPHLDFVRLLLHHGTQVDTMAGRCFATAARFDSIEVFRALGTRPFYLPEILRTLITCQELEREEQVVKWARLAIEATGANTSPRLVTSQLTKLAIERFSRGDLIVRTLLDQHFESGRELGSTVVWALQNPLRASDEVVLSLLSRGDHGEMALTSAQVVQSATHLAAISCRTLILERLIDLGVRMDTVADRDQTPLMLATMGGHAQAMLVLLNAQSTRNDGSMHIAARNASPRLIHLLRSHGHEIDWPIDTLDGRTPLAELCYSGQGDDSWVFMVEETMELLLPSVNKKETFKDKTLLHLAIENPKASVQVVRAFLRASKMHLQTDKDEQYLFFDRQTRLYYSPDMYVRHLCGNKAWAEKNRLITLLEASHFTPRYFAPAGEKQPASPIGLSQEVSEYLEEQRLRDEEKKRRDEEERQREVEHKAELARFEVFKKKELEMIQQKTNAEAYALAKKQDDELAHQRRLADQERLNHKVMLGYTQDLQDRQRSFRREEEHQALRHEKKVQEQRKELLALEDRRSRQRREDEMVHMKRLWDGANARRQLQITNGETYPGLDSETTAWRSDEEVD